MNRFPTNYEAYLASRAYAGQECGFWDLGCKAAQAGKFIQDSVLGEANALQQGAGGTLAAVRGANQASGDAVNAALGNPRGAASVAGKSIGDTSYNIQHGAADAAASVTKGLNQLKDSILGESNAIQQGLGGGLGGIPLPLLIGGGLAAIILVLVLTKR